jgi:hypothetical protein
MTRDGAIDGSFTAPRSLTVGTGWGDSHSVLEAPDRHPYRDASHCGVLRITLGTGLGRPSSTAPTA